MDPSLQVDLAQPFESDPLRDVDQVPDLHGVAGEKGDRLEQAAAPGVLAGERLDEPGEVRVEEVDQGPRDQLGDPAAAALAKHPALHDRALVVALDVLDARLNEQRAERPVGHPRMPVADVRVAPDDDVAERLVEALPERLALPAVGAVAGQHVRVLHDTGALACGDLARPVHGRGVDDQQLVDERHGLHQQLPRPPHDRTERRLLVQGR